MVPLTNVLCHFAIWLWIEFEEGNVKSTALHVSMWNPHHCMCLLLTRQNSLTYKWKWKAKSLCTHDCQCLSSYGRIVSFGYIKLSTRERYWEVEDCFSRLGKHFLSLRANVLVRTWNYLSHLGHQRIGALMKHSFRTQEACWTSKPNSSRSAEEAEKQEAENREPILKAMC